jgi:ubiquinone/menaquinone biosynthesis C-methylase UbiE
MLPKAARREYGAAVTAARRRKKVSKTLVQQQFGANAAKYTTSVVHAKGASLARLVELVQPGNDWVALDIATGAGHTAAAFAPHVARVVASDLTREMLEEARKLAASKGFANMETAQADAEKLPFADGTFNLVTCRIAPHHFPDVAAFVAESWRVLKPGGTFALVDNVSPDPETAPGYSTEELAEAARGYNAFEKLRDPSHGRALQTKEWTDLIARTGFKVMHVEHSPKAMDFASWCKTMAVAPDTVATLKTMLDGASPALKAYLKPSNDNGKLGFVLSELIAIGKKP